jgi:hypothetical protein
VIGTLPGKRSLRVELRLQRRQYPAGIEVLVNTTTKLELRSDQLAGLKTMAHELNLTPEAAAATLIEEGLRMREFPGIQFWDTDSGRQPYVAGFRMPLWHVAMVAREFGDDLPGIVEHLSIPRAAVEKALSYICAFSDEIDAAIADIEAAGDQLAATLPPEQVVAVT